MHLFDCLASRSNKDGYLYHGLDLYIKHEPYVQSSLSTLHLQIGKVVLRLSGLPFIKPSILLYCCCPSYIFLLLSSFATIPRSLRIMEKNTSIVHDGRVEYLGLQHVNILDKLDKLPSS